MPPGAIAAAALAAGVAGGLLANPPAALLAAVLVLLAVASVAAARCARSRATVVCVACGFAAAGAALALDARARALDAPLRDLLDREIGGFALHSLGPGGEHDPIDTRFVLREDASAGGGFALVRTEVTALRLGGVWQRVAPPAGVRLTVGGDFAGAATGEWRAGRTLTAPVVFRRPARFLNDGLPDDERELALDGTILFASAKSALLVSVEQRGTWIEELAADARARVRSAVARHVAPHGATEAAIVTAVLIGDRTALPADIRTRLQAAGVYHVIAISGGNIAILAGLSLLVLAIVSVRGRAAAALTLSVLVAYSAVVSAGPSVWRATLMAGVHLAARAFDHRAPTWHAFGVAAAVVLVLRPLDLRDPGFILTFGATAALIEGARRAGQASAIDRGTARGRKPFPRPSLVRRALALAAHALAPVLVASAVVELALMPVSAQAFSRVTCAGLVLNLVAVPAMAITQAAGLAVVMTGDVWTGGASLAGRVAYLAAASLVESARLVELAPWLARRVPPPGFPLLLAYYAALAALLVRRRRVRRIGACALTGAAILIVTGASQFWRPATSAPDALRLTMFDVGQAEALLLEAPGAPPLMVDAGGSTFEESAFDIGARVLAPALWARSVRTLGALLVTHGDPDHIGGAPSLVSDFRPGELWTGIEVPTHEPSHELATKAREAGARLRVVRAGDAFSFGPAQIRVLHPPEPDWERPRVRNDDSVVLEVRYGDVAFLLTGDIGADVERAIVPQLRRAPRNVLKVAHHGSRTSTSRELLDAWRPELAVISAGRGNRFGHPSHEALERLRESGARILRTDLDGQITIETDGRDIRVRTFVEATR